MKKLVALLVVTACATSAWAQDVQTIPPGDDQITPVRKGQPAPFDGQLFEPNTALRWANWLRQYQLVLKLDRQYNEKVCGASTDFLNRSLELERQKYTDVTADYQQREAELRRLNTELQLRLDNPPWYRSVWFGVAAGAVLTGAAVGLGAYMAK